MKQHRLVFAVVIAMTLPLLSTNGPPRLPGFRPGDGLLRGVAVVQWSQIKDDAIVLTADNTKTKRTREIPISPTLRTVLDRRC